MRKQEDKVTTRKIEDINMFFKGVAKYNKDVVEDILNKGIEQAIINILIFRLKEIKSMEKDE